MLVTAIRHKLLSCAGICARVQPVPGMEKAARAESHDVVAGGRMIGKILLCALIVMGTLIDWSPVPAHAGEMRLAARLLDAPKGRLSDRRRIVAPSMPLSSGGSYTPQAFKWFWKEISASRSAASAARWAKVMRVINEAHADGRPVFGSRSTAQVILDSYGKYLKRESERLDITLPLLIAVIEVESAGNPGARSSKGAGGLMQLMPGTAARFGVSNRYAPSQNIRGGATYLDWLLKYFNGDVILALAGYNAGEGAVDRHSGVPPYDETRNYIAKVAGAYVAAGALCRNPPWNVRGECVIE